MPQVQIERRRRGVFGWIFALVFWAWQILMLAWLVAGIINVGQQAVLLHSETEKSGAAIGTTIGVAIVLLVWALGSIILGPLMFFTRGRTEIVTIERK